MDFVVRSARALFGLRASGVGPRAKHDDSDDAATLPRIVHLIHISKGSGSGSSRAAGAVGCVTGAQGRMGGGVWVVKGPAIGVGRAGRQRQLLAVPVCAVQNYVLKPDQEAETVSEERKRETEGGG